jgi:hypothetical protein
MTCKTAGCNRFARCEACLEAGRDVLAATLARTLNAAMSAEKVRPIEYSGINGNGTVALSPPPFEKLMPDRKNKHTERRKEKDK